MLARVAMAAQLGGHEHRAARRTAAVVSARVLLLAALAVAVGAVHLPGRPRTLCMLRSLTGVPCPFCGGTTAVVELGHGRFLAAVAASPLAVALVAVLPLRGFTSLGRLWRRPATRWVLVGTVVLAAEIWQLHRFGHLGA